jgi:predicted ATPase
MYIDYIKIEHIRSIRKTEVPLHLLGAESLAGWHVFIGDNGSGKTSFIRSIALALMGPAEAASLRENWQEWLEKGESRADIVVNVQRDAEVDSYQGKSRPLSNHPISCHLSLQTDPEDGSTKLVDQEVPHDPHRYLWSGKPGWFSASFGPFRRFRGGDKDKEKIFYSNPRAAAHISAFGEDAALTEIESWFEKLHLQRLEGQEEAHKILLGITNFLNQGALLPHGAKLTRISSEGIFFQDGNGSTIGLNELSDGFRSVLSLTLELIRQMVRIYGVGEVFGPSKTPHSSIDLPGVVLIDEIDAHLHPTWQVRIGNWFTRYFPKLQFIVTTHSPLICRAAEKGSIWRLASPGTEESIRHITGVERKRLIYGNVLDAYGTEVFGQNLTSSDKSTDMRERLAELHKKSFKGIITPPESEELQQLQTSLPTGG